MSGDISNFQQPPIILGIDTSCDDTGIGITQGNAVLANVVASQTALHAKYGGIMPEEASREHLNVIESVLDTALEQAKLSLDDIDVIAATYGPGLIGALLVGLNFAKSIAWARDIPFVAIHHIEGHIASSLTVLEDSPDVDLQSPFMALIASGGHTSLFEVKAWGHYHQLGRSLDDAAGEAFDKVARLLELGYPGGPVIGKAAEQGDEHAFAFTRPLKQQKEFNFSLSGLKTAVATLVEKQPEAKPEDVAACFQYTVVDHLVYVCQKAAKATGLTKLVVAGGVAANKRLREAFAETELEVIFPPLKLATDNGAMIALAANKRIEMGLFKADDLYVDAAPYLPLAPSEFKEGVRKKR